MKILMEVSTYSYKTYHSLAKRIQEIYPGSQFGIATGPAIALSFLREQNHIKYEIFEENDNYSFADDIDYDELKIFQEYLPHKSLWRMIAADRGLGRAFVSGVVGYDNIKRSDRHYILQSTYHKIVQIKRIFDEFKPDIFIPAIAMGGVGVTILEQNCKKRGIPYAAVQSCRVKNLCAFASNAQIIFTQINEETRALIDGDIEYDLSSAEELYYELMNDLEAPDYFDLKNSRTNKFILPSSLHRIKYLMFNITFGVITKFFKWIWNCLKAVLKSNYAKMVGYSDFIIHIRNHTLSGFQHLRLSNPKFGEILEPSQKYLYYPLHVNPEYSTLVQGTMWQDQLMVVEALAKSVSYDWVVYVKEHPATMSHRIRPKSFYKRLKDIPNVKIAPIYMDMNTIINKAEMVAVISGTSGWEGILRGKPVINLSDHMFDELGLAKKCTDIEKLSTEIYDEIKRIKKILPEERKRRIICLLAAILKYGFWVTYPKQLFYIEPGTDEEYQVCGRELADGLVKHLNYLQKEKSNSFGIH